MHSKYNQSMTIVAERANPGGLSGENTTGNPLERMPSFDEYKKIREAEEQQAQEQNESKVLQRHIIATGERSTFYQLEMSDGSEGQEIESDFIEMASQFRKQHEDIKKDPELYSAMGGVSADLAIIDLTKGDCWNHGSTEERTILLTDYARLRGRLDNASSSADDKRIISQYFDHMHSEQLDFLRDRYNETNNINPNAELIKTEIENLKQTCEKKHLDFDEYYQDFEQKLKGIEWAEQNNVDYEELLYAIRDFQHVVEDAWKAGRLYKSAIFDYADALNHYKDSIDQQDLEKSMKTNKNAERDVNDRLEKMKRMDEATQDLRRKIEHILRG